MVSDNVATESDMQGEEWLALTCTQPHALRKRLLPRLRPAPDVTRLARDGVVCVIYRTVDLCQWSCLKTTVTSAHLSQYLLRFGALTARQLHALVTLVGFSWQFAAQVGIVAVVSVVYVEQKGIAD